MKVLLTGVAGFIGFHVVKKLLNQGHSVVGCDNINDYYDINLKFSRLNELGIKKGDAEKIGIEVRSGKYSEFLFSRVDLSDLEAVKKVYSNHKFDVVCHLAAQAGVRYSLKNVHAYVNSNLVGFVNIIEQAKNNNIKHFIYASSSSVYGLNSGLPYKLDSNVDKPVSFYAATKKSNELIAHTYSHLNDIYTTGLRFFTVYGPWGRPDMAYYSFTNAILNEKPIEVFNEGNLYRDFTFIDDIVYGVTQVILKDVNRKTKYKLYNIGNNESVKLERFIEVLEKELNKNAIKILKPMQPGDVKKTWACIDEIQKDYQYQPSTSIEVGLKKFIRWYEEYH